MLNNSSAGQEILRILWDLTANYNIKMNPPIILILIKIHPIHAISSNFFKIQINIIHKSVFRTCN